jgi:hypothetical protein
MNQILHIFRKDVRQFWREIALCVGLLATYARYEPVEPFSLLAGPNPDRALFLDYLWRSYFWVLLLFGWAFVMVRDIQAEVLVGDRQFWVTRPYEWQKLLAAKILFVVVVINLPLLVAQAIVLRRAGFAPLSYVPGLLWLQLLLTVWLVPLAVTLGTVTSNVGQAVLVVLGAWLYVAVTDALSSETAKSHWRLVTSLPSLLEPVMPVILIGTLVAVITLQFARRRTTLARGLLLGLAAALLLIAIGTSPPPPPLWIPDAREYPFLAAGEQPPVQLAFDPTKTARREPLEKRGEKLVPVRIPLQPSRQAEDSVVQTNGMLVTIDAGGGLRWSSAWQREPMLFLFPGQEYSQLDFAVDKDFFERTKSQPVAVQLSFVMTVFRQKDGRRVFITSEDFAVPGVGFCSTQSGMGDPNAIACRSPLRLPDNEMVSTVVEETTCPVSHEERPKLVGSTLQMGYGYEPSGPLTLNPLRFFTLDLHPPEGGRSIEWRLLCPGTPLVFSYLERLQRLRMEVDVSGLQLGNYEVGVGRLILKN